MSNLFNQDPNEEISENWESKILIRKSPKLDRKCPSSKYVSGGVVIEKLTEAWLTRAGRSWLVKVQFRKGGWVYCVCRRIVFTDGS